MHQWLAITKRNLLILYTHGGGGLPQALCLLYLNHTMALTVYTV